MIGTNSYYDVVGEGERQKRMMEGHEEINEYYYKECLRNHAASLGSYATDGCGEFTPLDTGGAMQCAACGCHRNFHRRVTCGVSCSSPAEGVSQRRKQMVVVEPGEWEARSPRKRLRTKFSAEQKEKMLEFAERLGWKMKRGKEEGEEIEGFCKGIGVSRKVFKVWMHNHKNNNSSYST